MMEEPILLISMAAALPASGALFAPAGQGLPTDGRKYVLARLPRLSRSTDCSYRHSASWHHVIRPERQPLGKLEGKIAQFKGLHFGPASDIVFCCDSRYPVGCWC